MNRYTQLKYIVDNKGYCPPPDWRGRTCSGCPLDLFCSKCYDNTREACTIAALSQLESYTEEEIFEELL